jgi:hypothetical protein
MALIEETFGSTILKELRSMKFILPSEPEREITRQLDELAELIESEFRKLLHG